MIDKKKIGQSTKSIWGGEQELRPKAKIIEKTFDKIKQNERRSRTNVA